MSAAQHFSKAEKLKSRKQIDVLFRSGRSFFAPPVKCYYQLHASPEANTTALYPVLAGVSVSKKNFRQAVQRNRIKRLLREAYRLHKQPLAAKLMTHNRHLQVFFVFTDKTMPAYALVEEKMKYCLRRLAKIAEEAV